MQSCLEIRSMDARHEMIARSDYQWTNQYESSHPDALADGDWQGKGTGHPGHGHYLPDPRQPRGLYYSNFDTDVDSNAGNGNIDTPNTDNWARRQTMTRSLYNADFAYPEYNDELYEGQFSL